MRRLLFFVLVFGLASRFTWAQTAGPLDQTELIRSLLERIDRLEKRVAQLEGKQEGELVASIGKPVVPASTKPAEASVAHAGGEPKAQITPEHQHEIPLGANTYPSLKLSGFGDLDFSSTDQPGTLSGFNMGQFILHAASPLSKKVSYFGEVSFSASQGGVGQPSSFALAVERSIIRYDYNDHFKLSFGKYHTPINYWNTAFHHGLWLQTTISRPEMIQFGGRFLPVHFVGLLAEGTIPSGGLGLNYSVGLGNGRATNISGAGEAGDANNNRAWIAGLFARPSRLYGLQIGGSFYGDKVTLAKGPSFSEFTTAAHLVWTKESPEFLAEAANVRMRNTLTGQVFDSQAFYVQAAYRLPGNQRRWKPYYRIEYIHSPASEPVLKVPYLLRSTFGIRYDITDYAAFKGEYRRSERHLTVPTINGAFLQTSFTF